MSALFAFEVGDVSMRSVTFGNVINALMARSPESSDRQACKDALELNCLWVYQIQATRKCTFISNLYAVLIEQLDVEVSLNNDVAIYEIRQVIKELSGRYSEFIS
jgi:hypothetical protein